MVRPRGRSQLGVDIRGDTSAPAMSTMNEVSPIEPTPPDLSKVRTYLGDPLPRTGHGETCIGTRRKLTATLCA
jgi:hypothetical protein